MKLPQKISFIRIVVQGSQALMLFSISSCSISNSQSQKAIEANIALINRAQANYYVETETFSANVIEKQYLPIKPQNTEFTYKTDIQPNSAFSYGLSQKVYYKSVVGGAFAFKDAEGRSYVWTILCRAKQAGSQSISLPTDKKTCGVGTERIEQ